METAIREPDAVGAGADRRLGPNSSRVWCRRLREIRPAVKELNIKVTRGEYSNAQEVRFQGVVQPSPQHWLKPACD